MCLQYVRVNVECAVPVKVSRPFLAVFLLRTEFQVITKKLSKIGIPNQIQTKPPKLKNLKIKKNRVFNQ